MNPIERTELEAEHDGCRNEHQRALAVSNMEPDARSAQAQAEAAELIAQGKHVAAARYPRYCPFTDAQLAQDGFCILAVADTRADLEAHVATLWGTENLDPEEWVEYLPS